MELRVRVININLHEHADLLTRCRPLNEYSTFVESVVRHSTADIQYGFDAAIQECINNGILSDYLQRKSKEVKNMFFGEYSYEDDIRVQRREAREEGIAHGLEQGEYRARLETARQMKIDGLSSENILKYTGLSLEELGNAF